MHRIRLVAVLLLAATSVAHAGGDGAGTTAANFLSVGQGASSLSMGGASLAAPGGLDAAAWNPAALGGLSSTQLTLAHASLASETSQEWASMGGRFGAGQLRWAASALYQSDGTFEGRDAFNQPTGTFRTSDMAVGLSLARPFGEGVTAGVGMKWVRESLGDLSGSGVGFDAGLQARSGPIGFGLAARNVGGSIRFDGSSFDMPAVFGAGVSWTDEASGLRLELDANMPTAYYNDVRAGAEWRWRDRVALRGGYRANLSAPEGEPLGGATFGLGLGANGFWFDYAFLAGDADAQGRHRLGVTFHPSALAALGTPGTLGADASAPTDPPAAARAPETAPVAAKPAAKPAKSQPEESAVAVSKPADAPKPARAEPIAAAPPAEPAAPSPAMDPARITRGVGPETTSSRVAERGATPGASPIEASKSVKVPKLIVPKLEAAPVAATTPISPASPVVAAGKPAARGEKPVASAPSAPVAALPAPPTRPAPVAVAPSEPEPDAQVVATRAPQVTVTPRSKSTPPGPRPASVVLQDGETLVDLAKRWNTSVPRLMMDNNLVTDRPKAGTRLKLPPAGSR